MRCNVIKPLNEYNKSKSGYYDGFDYYCKYCRSGANIASQLNKTRKCSLENCNRPHYAKTWCRMHYSRWIRHGSTESKHKELRGQERVYIYNGKKYYYKKNYTIESIYKISIEEYFKRSANGCELCGKAKDHRNFHVDHDHSCCNTRITCGKCVRGIVCARCNHIIDNYEKGLMRSDNPMRDKVIKYLEVYHGRQG